jgi:FMN phosphatase YigB (HAD superfamily)
VLALSGYEACETIFVDDGPENITVAESLGIHGLLVEKDADWMEALLDMVENYR